MGRFEDLYRNHRGVKEITKGKRNKNSRQHSPETEKEDLGSLLKEMRAIRGDIAKTNTKLDTVHTKIDNMEKHSKDTEKKIYKEMGKLREDMRINNEKMDMKIKDTINENLEPKYQEMKNFVSQDIRRIVCEELELREMAKNVSESEDTDNEKNEEEKKKKVT